MVTFSPPDAQTFYPLDRPSARCEPGLPEDVQPPVPAGRFAPRKGSDTVARALRLLTERPVHRVLAEACGPLYRDLRSEAGAR